jgi:acetylornithine deacetylase/succinyl-diaminopimelate desuccinylase-like protein
MLDEALGDLAPAVELIPLVYDPSSQSPTETPLWDSLSRVTRSFYPGSTNVPYLTVGATDARFFRALDITAYGFGLFSERMRFEDYGAMFHGDNERIDVDSLRLSTDLWHAVAHDLLD